jgi:hypothetical protein
MTNKKPVSARSFSDTKAVAKSSSSSGTAKESVAETLERARQNVKSIVKKEKQGEVISSEVMAFRLK